jgi:hypothetical protein
MNFTKDGNNIKLESIMDNGKALDITKYSEPLLSIGADGKYTRTSIELSDTKESSNNEVNSNTQEDNQVITATSNNSGELTTQEVESPNTEQNNPNDANTLDQACKDLELEPGCENNKTDPNYKKKYRDLARKYHPDTCDEKLKPCEPMMKKINAANEKLNNYNHKKNEASNQEANTKPLEIENSQPSVSSVFSFENKLQENKSVLPTNIPVPPENNRLPVPPENNRLQVAIRKGGKTKRRKAGKKNKSKRVRFMSRRNRRR